MNILPITGPMKGVPDELIEAINSRLRMVNVPRAQEVIQQVVEEEEPEWIPLTLEHGWTASTTASYGVPACAVVANGTLLIHRGLILKGTAVNATVVWTSPQPAVSLHALGARTLDNAVSAFGSCQLLFESAAAGGSVKLYSFTAAHDLIHLGGLVLPLF